MRHDASPTDRESQPRTWCSLNGDAPAGATDTFAEHEPLTRTTGLTRRSRWAITHMGVMIVLCLTLGSVVLGGCSAATPTARRSSSGASEQPSTVTARLAVSQPAVTATETADAQARAREARGSSATPTRARFSAPLVLRGHTAQVTALAWSPDGTVLASSSGNVAADGTVDPTVWLWSDSGALLATLVGHAGAVTSLAWSPDGRILASGSRDGTVRLWRVYGAPLVTLPAAAGQVLSLSWSPDSTVLAVGSIEPSSDEEASGIVRLFHPDGTLIRSLFTDGGGGKWLHVAWSPDGRTLAAGAWGFRLWRRDGTLIASIRRGGSPVPAFAWSPDGQLLAIGNEDGVVSLYTATGQLVASVRGVGTVERLAFSPDNRTLAVLSRDAVWLVDTHDPQAGSVLVHRHQSLPGFGLAWSPDGRWLAATTEHGLQVWRADGTSLTALEGCGDQMLVVAWAPDGRSLAGGSKEQLVCLWRVEDKED